MGAYAMNVPVIWYQNKDGMSRGWWDQGLLEALFAGELWNTVGVHTFEHLTGMPTYISIVDESRVGIAILPARHLVGEEERVNAELRALRSVIVMVVGDEENSFDISKLNHPRMLIYQQTSPSDGSSKADRYLPLGWPPQAKSYLPKCSSEASERNLNYYFSGQDTHSRRHECLSTLARFDSGDYPGSSIMTGTKGFTQGDPHDIYYYYMASAKIAPCPSGPVTPDTFRLYEALEAGCLPIADDRTPRDDKPSGYWRQLFNLGDDLPFPIVQEWSELPGLMKNMLDRWPSVANKAFAWWQGYKRQLVYQVHDDITRLSGNQPESTTLLDKLTVLIPSSPIKAHPDTSMIEETINSVRERLPDSEIIIMLDGVRQEQEDRRADYEEYQRRLLWKCNHEWNNVLPLRFEEHHHQAAMTREALKLVRTPAVLYCEQDTGLVTDEPIDVEGIVSVLIDDEMDVIRLHHESHVLPDHKHMMLDEQPYVVNGVPLLRTAQYSQRPHFARTDFYRRIIDEHFSRSALCFIEDRMHSVAHEAFRLRGKAGWQRYRIALYAPDGNIKRSWHSDGRAGGPKYDDKQVF
jgi:hypothetical protein